VHENGWSGWPLWGSATASAALISPNFLHCRVVKCQGIVCVQVSSNLGEKRGDERLGKEATQPASLKKKNNIFSANYALVL